MLLEISRVRIIVVRLESNSSGVIGRAIAITRLVSALVNNMNGRCLRRNEDRTRAFCTKDKLEK